MDVGRTTHNGLGPPSSITNLKDSLQLGSVEAFSPLRFLSDNSSFLARDRMHQSLVCSFRSFACSWHLGGNCLLLIFFNKPVVPSSQSSLSQFFTTPFLCCLPEDAPLLPRIQPGLPTPWSLKLCVTIHMYSHKATGGWWWGFVATDSSLTGKA